MNPHTEDKPALASTSKASTTLSNAGHTSFHTLNIGTSPALVVLDIRCATISHDFVAIYA